MDMEDLLHSYGRIEIDGDLDSVRFNYQLELDASRKYFTLSFDSQDKINAIMIVLALSHMLNNMKASMGLPDSDLSDILLRLRSQKGVH